jgi:transcriptional regulator with XRE-family HTH domain
MTATEPHLRFREARERRGLSAEHVAESCGFHPIHVWEIEGLEGDLTDCYSPGTVRKFCRVLGIRPIELFTDKTVEPPVSVEELVQRIHEECRLRGITLEQFEDIVEYPLTDCIQRPEKLLEDMFINSLQRLCQELRIDWLRVISSL